MALRGEGGIDPFLFGDGRQGVVAFDVATDLEGVGDTFATDINFVKAAPGDPDYTVYVPGSRFFATNKITIGPGVTVSANGNDGIITAGGLAQTAGTIGAGSAGGDGGNNSGGTAGSTSTNGMGGNGGTGGVDGHAHLGGSGGLADRSGFLGSQDSFYTLYHGFSVVNGSVLPVRGGAGGGGGAAFIGGDGGGGVGGGGYIVMCAPIIEIQATGILSAKGGAGITAGLADAGGGGGGGGGVIVLVYGTLIVNGTINVNGGNAGNGFGAGNGGVGGHAGQVFRYSPVSGITIITAGSNGSNGTP